MTRGARAEAFIAKLMAQGKTRRQAEQMAAFSSYPRQIGRRTVGSRYGR